MTRLQGLLVAAFVVVSANPANAACSGNACSSVRLYFQNSCLRITNNNQKTVSVGVTLFGSSGSWTLLSGQDIQARHAFSNCINAFSDYTANVVNIIDGTRN